MIIAYTDGSCHPNPGPGGWGFISFDTPNNLTNATNTFYVKGGEKNATNNRMELLAVIECILFHKKETHFIIHTDSQITMKCAMKEFKRNANTDLWKIYDDATLNKKIEYVKVKAHSGDKYNEEVDTLANEGRKLLRTYSSERGKKIDV